MIYLEANQVPNHLKFGYSGKSFKAEVCEKVYIPSYAGNWDSGSRDTYSAIELATGKSIAASNNYSAPWDNDRKDQHIALRSGFAVIRHSIFCGRDMGLTFYVHPEDAVKLLPQQTSDLSDIERKVLKIIKSYKSAYRVDEARRQGVSEAQYREAMVTLQAQDLLDKRGAITTKGKNAAQ
jgi:hypothetical protein